MRFPPATQPNAFFFDNRPSPVTPQVTAQLGFSFLPLGSPLFRGQTQLGFLRPFFFPGFPLPASGPLIPGDISFILPYFSFRTGTSCGPTLSFLPDASDTILASPPGRMQDGPQSSLSENFRPRDPKKKS